MSRLTQARGLKLVQYDPCLACGRVAPYAGAWIETLSSSSARTAARSSRLTQARGLKHSLAGNCGAHSRSRLTQARGLKRVCHGQRHPTAGVAPYAGAWIETTPGRTSAQNGYASRLTQARGLKHHRDWQRDQRLGSRLTQARGLKPPPFGILEHLGNVAPYAGAWIETYICPP